MAKLDSCSGHAHWRPNDRRVHGRTVYGFWPDSFRKSAIVWVWGGWGLHERMLGRGLRTPRSRPAGRTYLVAASKKANISFIAA
jgi:hypothetical protein